MKLVICLPYEQTGIVALNLTPGKEYIVKETVNSKIRNTYLLINDNGVCVYYKKEMFKERSEIRDEKLNKLGI